MPAANVAAHKSAFESSLSYNGEAVTFRGQITQALFNRSKDRPTWKLGANSDAPGGVSIWLRASFSEPKQGEVITDSDGTKHRIESANLLGFAWACECASN